MEIVHVGGMVIRVGLLICKSEWSPLGQVVTATVGVKVCSRIWSA